MTLNPAERAAYTAAINAPGVRTGLQVKVLDLDHKLLANVSGVLTGGQVDLQRKGEVHATAGLDLVDLDTDLADFDLRHLVQVTHGVRTPDHGWLWTDAITGWVVATVDEGDTASLTLHDKSAMGLMPGAPTRHWREGMPVARAIRLMFEDLGETKFDIPRRLETDGPTLARDMESGGPDPKKCPTLVARRMTRGKLHVFYSPSGHLTVRRPMEAPAVSWEESLDGAATGGQTSRIRLERDLRQIRNVVVGRGRKKLHVVETADNDHLYSPRSLARGPAGDKVPMRLKHYLVDETIARERELRQVCRAELRRLLREQARAQFECVPNFLAAAPFTLVRAERRDGKYGEFYLDEASLPLFGGEMSVGKRTARQRTRRSGRGLVLS